MQIKLKEIKINVKYKQETDLFIDNSISLAFQHVHEIITQEELIITPDNANEKLEDLNLLIKHLQETVRLISGNNNLTCKKEQ